MKKVTTFLLALPALLLTTLVSHADTTYRLIDQNAASAAEALTGQLKFDYTSRNASESRTIEGVAFNYYTRTSGGRDTVYNTGGKFESVIGYDCKTKATAVTLYLYTQTNDARSFYISELKEGDNAEIHRVKYTLSNKESKKITWNTTNTTNSSLFFYGSTDIRIFQIEITESGDPLPLGGEPGYTINFNKGRGNFCTYNANTPNPIEQIDGIEVVAKEAYTPINKTQLLLKTNDQDYIKFKTTASCKLTMTFAAKDNTDRIFYISNAKGAQTGTQYHSSKNYTLGDDNCPIVEAELQGNQTYYINPNGTDVKILSMTFTSLDSSVDAPENFAVSNAGVVSFDPVEGATRYTLTIYDTDGETPLTQKNVENNETLTRPLKKGGDYKVTLVASGSGGTSDAVEATWHLESEAVAEENLEASEYCSSEIGADNSLANMTWETDDDGNVNLSISGDGATWRTANAFDLVNFKIGNNLAASLYFAQEYTEGSTIYKLKKKTGKTIALGESISFSGRIRWATASDNNAYKDYSFAYTYGTICNEPDVLTTYTLSAGVEVAKVGTNVPLTIVSKNQKGTDMDVSTEYTISPADAGTVTNGVYVPSKKGLATITASSENDKSSEITIFAYSGDNLAYHTQKEASSGYYSDHLENEYVMNAPSLAVNNLTGNNNYWQAYSSQTCEANAEFDAWITLDLGGYYDIDLVSVLFLGNASSRKYHIDFSSDYSEWTTAYSYNQSGGGANRRDNWYTNTTDNKDVRYVRFFSEAVNNTYGLKIAEIYVYGVLSADTEAPVMVSAAYSDVTTNSVVLSVSATDNTVVTGYRLKGDKTGDYTATDGAFTVDGLLSGKAYSINVYALDQAGNESANYKTVTFTTEGDAPVAGAVNLAEGKTATAGSSEGGNTADKAVDGDKTSANSRWGNYGKVADAPENNWWQVDLAKAYSLDSVKITWQHYPDYNGIVIRGSYDGSHWFDIVEYTGEKYATNAVQTIEMPEGAAARYVRIANRTGSGTSKWYMSFFEVEVYGTGGAYTMSLAEKTNNSSVIAENNNGMVIATLDRSFNAGTLYTLCLPFDVSAEQMTETFGTGYELHKLVSSERKSNNDVLLNFSIMGNMEAGKPYLFRSAQDVTSPVVFSGVTVDASASTTITTALFKMVGYYNLYPAQAEDLFLGSDTYLHKSSATSYAFRAYFRFVEPNVQGVRARAVLQGANAPTEIDLLDETDVPQTHKLLRNGQIVIIRDGVMYNALGQRVE